MWITDRLRGLPCLCRGPRVLGFVVEDRVPLDTLKDTVPGDRGHRAPARPDKGSRTGGKCALGAALSTNQG